MSGDGTIDLGQFGAPGFSLNDRIDLSGHKSGRVDPHVNTVIEGPNGNELRGPYRDLSSNQMPGFNGMQDK
jgi:hypothetical protein